MLIGHYYYSKHLTLIFTLVNNLHEHIAWIIIILIPEMGQGSYNFNNGCPHVLITGHRVNFKITCSLFLMFMPRVH